MDYQFYATPNQLGQQAWEMFQDRKFVRILECSAGEGDLIDAAPSWEFRRQLKIDACEIDLTKHPILREKGINVVGLDFLQLSNGAIYSHFVMNPPFAQGAEHVLQAWSLAWNAEIVAILNAETIRNPYSKERELLVQLIGEHGQVKYVQGAFLTPETKRKTPVEIALVYLKKSVDLGRDVLGDLIGDLRNDRTTPKDLCEDYQELHALAIPNSTIENAVVTFQAAVKAMQEAAFASARANYYQALLGKTMAERRGQDVPETKSSTIISDIQTAVGENYASLKDRAWATILDSTEIERRLSSMAANRLRADFDSIKRLDFTTANIYGFLCGLVERQGDIQIEMACDVFDLITRYHTENRVHYKGWKSNDKHRTLGMKIKATRFVIPARNGYSHGFSHETGQMLADFDKVFALLDGKHEPEFGLQAMARSYFKNLRQGERISSSYFDLRYYPGVGTLHFFPRDKKLMDRFNRMVGRHRQWIPHEGVRVSDAFWLQYDKAEKFDTEFHAEVSKRHKSMSGRSDFFWRAHHGTEQERQAALGELDAAITAVLESHGIDVVFALENKEASSAGASGAQLLLAA